MPRPYSTDLRERVLAACERGLTIEEVARQFEVSTATVKHWRQLRRHTGSVEPAPHDGGNSPRVIGHGLEVVSQIVREQPDLTLEEIVAEYPTVDAQAQDAEDWVLGLSPRQALR